MTDKMLQEQHRDVGNNEENAIPKGFCPDYFHRLRFIRENSDFYIQQENLENFRNLSWYSKKLENSANRFQSVRETKEILENLIYMNSVSGVCTGDATGVFAKRKTVDFETTRPDNLKTWTAYGNFDRNHLKPVVTTKADVNEVNKITSTHQKTVIHGKPQADRLKRQLLEQYGILNRRCSYDTKTDADVKTSSSTEIENSKQILNEAVEELKDAGTKEKKADKGRPNFLTKLWRRITRQRKEKTSAEKENKFNATVKKHSTLSSLFCSGQPKTNV